MHTFVTRSLEKLDNQISLLTDNMEGELKQLRTDYQEQPYGPHICTRDFLDHQLRQFYPRHEMDALMARVWWRLGQNPHLNKITGVPGATMRSEGLHGATTVSVQDGQPSAGHNVTRPVRPQSARSATAPRPNCNLCDQSRVEAAAVTPQRKPQQSVV